MQKTIFVSAGHGGGDSGAVSLDGWKEADLAQRLRNRIASDLRSRGCHVVTDGAEGENKALREAVALAGRNNGPSVEIHFNAGPLSAHGVEALAHPECKVLSQELCEAVARILKNPLRGERGWKPADAGQHHRLAFCDAGGIVLEVCFLSNADEVRAYLAHETEIAAALADVLASAVTT